MITPNEETLKQEDLTKLKELELELSEGTRQKIKLQLNDYQLAQALAFLRQIDVPVIVKLTDHSDRCCSYVYKYNVEITGVLNGWTIISFPTFTDTSPPGTIAHTLTPEKIMNMKSVRAWRVVNAAGEEHTGTDRKELLALIGQQSEKSED